MEIRTNSAAELGYAGPVGAKRTRNTTASAVDSYIASVLLSEYAKLNTWRAVGAHFACSHVHALNVSKGANAGPDLETSVAEKLHGGSVDALRRAARLAAGGAAMAAKERCPPVARTDQQMAEQILVADGWPELDVVRASGVVCGRGVSGAKTASWWYRQIATVLGAGCETNEAPPDVASTGVRPRKRA